MANHTREEIMAEPAGPRFDSWIATEVLGWELLIDNRGPTPRKSWRTGEYLNKHCPAWSPSTDVAAAWEVLGKLNWEIKALTWYRGFWTLQNSVGDSRDPDQTPFIAASAPTAPLAICRAALLTTLKSDVSQTNPQET